VLGETPGDFGHGELCRRDDRLEALEVALPLRPTQAETSGRLTSRQVDPGVLLEAEARGLQDGRNGGADDVAAMRLEIGMAARGYAGKAIPLVPVEGDLEHGALEPVP
jgi:hypothetical protein